MILRNQKAEYVNKLLYEHITTGENTSGNKLVGYASDLEVCGILDTLDLLPKEELNKFKNGAFQIIIKLKVVITDIRNGFCLVRQKILKE